MFILLCLLPVFSLFSLEEGKFHSLFLMQQNQVEESLARYRESVERTNSHDFEILQKMGQILLKKGSESQDPQVFLMTLFGAGLSGAFGAIEILEKGVEHPDPQIQLLTLHFLTQIEDDKTAELFNRAMSSDFLSTRMEAAFYLAQRKHRFAVGQIEGLMFRLPPPFKPYFPSLFAILGTNEATKVLRRLVDDQDPQVRVESILNIARLGRDDFLPTLRKRLKGAHIAELEAVLFAIGALKDSSSIPKLKHHSLSQTDSIRLASALSLFRLGDRTAVPMIEQLALKQNLFAIATLGEIPGSEEILASFLDNKDIQVRINAAVSLLQRKDARCLSGLSEILLLDERDLAFHPFASMGRTFHAIKAVPSAELRAKDPTLNLSFSLAMREHLLREAMHLPEPVFLQLGHLIFDKKQNDLVPILIGLLENLQTKGAIELLKKGASKIGSPLIRDYCHLSLYRLKQEGPYAEYINHWIRNLTQQELIQLRPLLPWKYRLEQSDYILSPEETSHLLIETFVAIANRRDAKSIAFLLEAIETGNPINRYALMGLLMRSTE